jgi:tRNA(Ile)-lysidine synthase
MTLHLLKFALERLGVRPGRNHLFRLLKLAALPTGRRLRLGTRVAAEKGRDHLWLYAAARALAEVEVHVPGVTALPDGSRLLVEPFSRSEPYPPGDFRIAAALPDTRSLHLRPAHEGDRIHPFGSRGTRLVFDLLSEAGVPRYLRTRTWVLEGGNRILWLLGHRPAEETRVLPDSREIYQFRWETGESRESAS